MFTCCLNWGEAESQEQQHECHCPNEGHGCSPSSLSRAGYDMNWSHTCKGLWVSVIQGHFTGHLIKGSKDSNHKASWLSHRILHCFWWLDFYFFQRQFFFFFVSEERQSQDNVLRSIICRWVTVLWKLVLRVQQGLEQTNKVI